MTDDQVTLKASIGPDVVLSATDLALAVALGEAMRAWYNQKGVVLGSSQPGAYEIRARVTFPDGVGAGAGEHFYVNFVEVTEVKG